MATKYTQSLAVLLNNGEKQILPVSKANLIELVGNTYTNYFNNKIASADVDSALAYIAGTHIPAAIAAANNYTDTRISELGTNVAQTESGKAITSIIQTEGVVTATPGNINSQYVEVTNGTTNYGENGGTVQGALSYLADYIGDVSGKSVITVTRSTEDSSYAAVYTIKQNNIQVGDAINIPLDLVATNGTLVYSRPRTAADGEGDGNIAGTYISMSIAHGDPFYIDVKDLIEYNTFNDSTEINFTDTNHTITAEVGIIASSKISYNGKTVDAELGTINGKINILNGDVNTTNSVRNLINTAVTGLDSTAASAKTENGFTYVITGVQEVDGLLTGTSYEALSDEKIKTTIAAGDDLYELANRDPQHPKNISDVKAALNTLASEISAAQGDAVTAVSYNKNNTYVNVGDGTAINSNTLTITIDDSNLGNVSKLQYNELTVANLETVTLYGANPES